MTWDLTRWDIIAEIIVISTVVMSMVLAFDLRQRRQREHQRAMDLANAHGLNRTLEQAANTLGIGEMGDSGPVINETRDPGMRIIGVTGSVEAGDEGGRLNVRLVHPGDEGYEDARPVRIAGPFENEDVALVTGMRDPRLRATPVEAWNA